MFTLEELKEILDYSPDTGEFRAVVSRSRAKAGDVVGTVTSNGYVNIMVRGKFYKGHRLACFFVNGEWPSQQVDHINGDRADNRWCNLRPCSRAQNSCNRKKYLNNSTSVTGVYWHKKSQRWVASIDVSKKRINLGYFDSLDAAAAVRRAAELEYFGDFARAA